MQEIVFAALVPHPPLLVPAVGGHETERVKTTVQAMERLAADLVEQRPDVVVIISPHGPVFQDAVAVHMLPEVRGDFSPFGAPEACYQAPVDQALAHLVVEQSERAGVTAAPVTPEWAEEWGAAALDHGTLVPLHFLQQAGYGGAILPIAMGLLPPVRLYAFGKALQRAIDRSGRRVAVLASGDLSHRLTPEAPDGFHPDGAQFDREVVEALGRGDLQHLFQMDRGLCEAAGECGLRPLMMLAGSLDGMKVKPQVASYEGPFGVGYAVVSLAVGGPDPERQLLPTLEKARQERVAERHRTAHPVAILARAALEHYVKTGLEIDFSAGAPHEGTASWQLPPELPERAAVFVSLKLDGDLRGCMGSTEPCEPTLALEIVHIAILAGTGDPRFSPVEEEELPFLDYTVDVLGEPERCTLAELDPKQYGVIVAKGEERGLLLPDLPGVDSAEAQVEIACSKAGLSIDDPDVALYRFQVQRFR